MLQLSNNPAKFGAITKFVHWSIVILFLTQFTLIYCRWSLPDGAPEKLQYILLHKSLGVLLLGLGVFMVLWRHVGQRPEMLDSMPLWEALAARISHLVLYVCILLMPLTGFLMSQYSGYGVKFFGLSLPQWVSTSKPTASTFHTAHQYVSYVVIGIVAIHVLAALKHHFIDKDTVLRRMLPFVKP